MIKRNYDEDIRVQVTKRLPKDELRTVIEDFVRQGITFAISKHNSDYEIWRQILPGDRPRVKNRKDGMTPDGVISQDPEELEQRNFVCIWENGEMVEGSPEIL